MLLKAPTVTVALSFLLTSTIAIAQTTDVTKKELFLPPKIWNVPDGNDFSSNDSEFSNQRKVESDDIALFWSKEYGDDPATNPNPNKRFDPSTALKECERFYRSYVDDLEFVDKGHSLTDKYKALIFVIGGDEGTAFGGGTDQVESLWTPASRINRTPYGVLAHELGHSFQYIVHADGAWGFSSAPKGSRANPIAEMTSQYMLWQVYPEWMTFEHYHLVDYLKQTHLAFLHEDNQYHSPYVLEYWSNKRGVDFVGKLWREAKQGEDPVMAYKRLNSLSQAQFNDEMFDAARHFITWDMKRVEKVAAPYANQHTSTLNEAGDGWYRIAPNNCPQNYGYNGIKLKVPAPNTKVTFDFKGIAGTEGFRAIDVAKAGWRYGFLAVKEDGSRVYGQTFYAVNGTAEFTVSEKTTFLWLVVMGAPTDHSAHIADGKPDNDEQWPYQIKLSGTSLDDSMIR